MGLDMFLFSVKKTELADHEAVLKLDMKLRGYLYYASDTSNEEEFKAAIKDNDCELTKEDHELHDKLKAAGVFRDADISTYDRAKAVGWFGEYGLIKDVIAYWRKANAIHRWFVENVQGGEDECNPHPVTYNDVIRLLELCGDVIEHYDAIDSDNEEDERYAALLPTTAGFFFGSTVYDDKYIDSIKYTIKTLSELDEEYFENNYVTYESSW